MSPSFGLFLLAALLCLLVPARALPLGTYIATCVAASFLNETVYLNQYFTLGNAAQYDLYFYSADIFSDSACSNWLGSVELQGNFVVGQPGSYPTTSYSTGSPIYTTAAVNVTWTSWTGYASSGYGPILATICGFESFPEGESINLFPYGCSTLGLPPQSSCSNFYDVLDLHPTYIYTGYSNVTFGVCNPSSRTTVLDDVDIYTIPYYVGSSSATSYCPSTAPNAFGGIVNSPTSPTPAANSVSKSANCVVVGGTYNYYTGRVLENSGSVDYCCLTTGQYTESGNCVSGCNSSRPLDTSNPDGFFYFNKICYTRCVSFFTVG